MGEVAIRLFHLLIMDVGELELCLGRLRHVGEEGFKILVFDFGLGQRGGTALGVPGISHRQLGARNVFRIRIGVDQGLQRHSRDFEAVVLHRVHGPVKQYLVGLLGAEVRQRVLNLLVGAGRGK